MKKKLLLPILFLGIFCAENAYSQTINTVAGSTSVGFSGDGGPATAAGLNWPGNVAPDASGNFYIPDVSNGRVRKVTASGTITTFAGSSIAGYGGDGGAASAAKLYAPTGVAVDGSGNVYIADCLDHVIRKVNTAGVITTVVGTGTGWGSWYGGSLGGDGGSATAAHLNGPFDVAVDGSGNLYITDVGNHRIRKVDASSGIITSICGGGSAGHIVDGIPATAANCDGVDRITVDNHGNVYFADRINNLIRRIDSMGIIHTIAGDTTFATMATGAFSGDGGPATSAKFNQPTDIAVDATGNIYITDTWNNRIRKIGTSGIVSTVCGTGTAGFSGDGGAPTSADIWLPAGIALASSGDIYFNDSLNVRIRKVSTSSSTLDLKNTTGSVSALKVFPNPGNGTFTVELNGMDGKAMITVLDITGKVIDKREVVTTGLLKENFKLRNVSSGTYYVTVGTEQGEHKQAVVVR